MIYPKSTKPESDTMGLGRSQNKKKRRKETVYRELTYVCCWLAFISLKTSARNIGPFLQRHVRCIPNDMLQNSWWSQRLWSRKYLADGRFLTILFCVSPHPFPSFQPCLPFFRCLAINPSVTSTRCLFTGGLGLGLQSHSTLKHWYFYLYSRTFRTV